MGKRQNTAFTPHADIRWFGEVDDDFRKQAEATVGAISDEAWTELQSVIRGYSMLLNHELVAVPLVDQKRGVGKLLGATDALLDAVDEVDTMEMGVVVTNRLPDTWERVYDHGAEYDRNENKIVASLASLMGGGDEIATLLMGEDHDPTAQAWDIVGDWRANGVLVRPSYPADFITLLREFRETVALFHKGLSTGDEYHSVLGEAWVGFVGRLTDWAKAHGVSAFVSNDEDRGTSKFLALVKLILALVPEMRDDQGKLEERQMRRPPVADGTLSKQIFAARAEYEKYRPKPDGENKDSPAEA